MRRLLVTLAAVASLLVPAVLAAGTTATPATAADPGAYTPTPAGDQPGRATTHARADAPPFFCSGEVQVAKWDTGTNLYTTTANTCLYDQTGTFDIGTVNRFRCYRNGNLIARCRWTWNQIMQRAPIGTLSWELRTSEDFCYTCGGAYVSDSGRFYGATNYALWCGWKLRGAIRTDSDQPAQVRFKGNDGSTKLLYMATNVSKEYPVDC